MELKKCKRFYTEIVGNEKNNQKGNRKATCCFLFTRAAYALIMETWQKDRTA